MGLNEKARSKLSQGRIPRMALPRAASSSQLLQVPIQPGSTVHADCCLPSPPDSPHYVPFPLGIPADRQSMRESNLALDSVLSALVFPVVCLSHLPYNS